MSGFIYAVSWLIPGMTDVPVKIGSTRNWAVRAASYITHSPYELELIGLWEVDEGEMADIEQQLLVMLRDHQVRQGTRSEWFAREGVLQIIPQIKPLDAEALLNRRRIEERVSWERVEAARFILDCVRFEALADKPLPTIAHVPQEATDGRYLSAKVIRRLRRKAAKLPAEGLCGVV